MPLNTVRSLVCGSFLFKVVLQHNWVVLPGFQSAARVFCLQLTVVTSKSSLKFTHRDSKNRPRNHPKWNKYQATYYTYLRYTEPKQQILKTSSVSWKGMFLSLDGSHGRFGWILWTVYTVLGTGPNLKEYTPIWFDSFVCVLKKTFQRHRFPRNIGNM